MKTLLSILLLTFSYSCFTQSLPDYYQQSFSYNLAGGADTIETDNLLGFARLAFELRTTSLDSATATIQIQKSNSMMYWLNIVGATITFNAGTNTNFIEVLNAKNAWYRAIVTPNTVTSGNIYINLTGTK